MEELRGIAEQRTLQHCNSEANANNELSMLSEKVQSLQKEKEEWMDKYAKYGEEIKAIITAE